MPYRIMHDHSIADEIQRIVEEQINRGIAEIDDDTLGRHEAVHQVRKRCKKVRAVLRLVRGPLDVDGTYDRENAWFRDAAGELSYMRDAEALIETYDTLMEHFREPVDRGAFGPIRGQLTRRRKEIAERNVELGERLVELRAKLREGRDRVPEWALCAGEFETLLPGVAKTYRRGRKAMAAAYDDPTAERFHEWRKRVKYHWYHCRLLGDAWRPEMNARRTETSRLADLLGDEHDLSVFRETLSRERDSFGGDETREALLGLIERRREQLRKEARPLGARVFAEDTQHFIRRVGIYWEAGNG